MRNGMNGIGFVFDTDKMSFDDEAKIAKLDHVFLMTDGKVLRRVEKADEEMSFLRRDVYLIIMGSDDRKISQRIKISKAGRIVFVGNPGKMTLDALKEIDGHPTLDRRCYIIPRREAACRVMWRRFEDPTVEYAGKWKTETAVRAASIKSQAPVKKAPVKKAPVKKSSSTSQKPKKATE